MTGGPGSHARGLTLVEVVVALAVLSLVVLALAASLRGVSSVADRLDRHAAATDDLGVAAGLLNELFDRWVPIRTGDAEAPWLFETRPNAVAWVASMPNRFGAAGLHALRLSLEGPLDGDRALVLRFAPFAPEVGQFPDWDRAEARVLVVDVVALGIFYNGQGLSEGWRAELASKEGTPNRVRIDLQTATGGQWPPLVFVVRTPDRDAGRASFGSGS